MGYGMRPDDGYAQLEVTSESVHVLHGLPYNKLVTPGMVCERANQWAARISVRERRTCLSIPISRCKYHSRDIPDGDHEEHKVNRENLYLEILKFASRIE
jgi:hypothetical protein